MSAASIVSRCGSARSVMPAIRATWRCARSRIVTAACFLPERQSANLRGMWRASSPAECAGSILALCPRQHCASRNPHVPRQFAQADAARVRGLCSQRIADMLCLAYGSIHQASVHSLCFQNADLECRTPPGPGSHPSVVRMSTQGTLGHGAAPHPGRSCGGPCNRAAPDCAPASGCLPVPSIPDAPGHGL